MCSRRPKQSFQMRTIALIATLSTGLAPILCVYFAKALLSRFGGREAGKIQSFVSSFCAGALLSDVFGHLISGADDHSHGHGHSHSHSHGHSHLAIMAGFAVSFAFDLFPFGHSCHSSHHQSKSHAKHQHRHSASLSTQLATLIHCFTDGLTIAAAFLKSEELGFSTCYAMLLHEIPHRLRDLLVLKVSALQLASQLSCALVAAALTLQFGAKWGEAVELLLPFSAGGFVYLAASSMIPEVREGPGSPLLKLICFSIGILLTK